MATKCMFRKGKVQRNSVHEKNTVSADIITLFIETLVFIVQMQSALKWVEYNPTIPIHLHDMANKDNFTLN
jgi:hypothetical protein